ncbi:MAG TPA: hypothetical protein VN923_07870 [Thermoanaerobaculia bacterium]|nr:hypothetical protein [Thermoanaerobaculia bacterium]
MAAALLAITAPDPSLAFAQTPAPAPRPPGEQQQQSGDGSTPQPQPIEPCALAAAQRTLEVTSLRVWAH